MKMPNSLEILDSYELEHLVAEQVLQLLFGECCVHENVLLLVYLSCCPYPQTCSLF